MTTKARREELMVYLADADDKKINALYEILEDGLRDSSFKLTDEQMEIVEKRRSEFLSGKTKPAPWQEVHARIRAKRNNS